MSKRYFNEATRVQMPALVHLTRLGYIYAGKISDKEDSPKYDPETNILTDVFIQQFEKLNPERTGEALETLREIKQELDNDDLGQSFYKRLVTISPVKLIDFEEPMNNSFHCTAEFTCKNGLDEFRPDITLFVNGLPLAFVEVKKPNNVGGMVAESERMNSRRFPNRKFRRFINISQLMIFSNNMEYDTLGGITPIQGVFYCTGARARTKFSTFCEENPLNEPLAPYNKYFPYLPVDQEIERRILSDFNVQVIKQSPEYQTNLDINTPTNRVLTSMCSPERLLFLLQYGFAFVKTEKEVDGKLVITDQKHIMRYQQMFAALAIREKLDEGVKSGVIWHTQGSGKTALSYFLNKVLTDYYAKQNIVAKFYFIVDRLDLLDQASKEFEARGLQVKTANSRKELMDQFKTNQSLEGDSGKAEITVVNIQRFAEDRSRIDMSGYATNLQRIFIVDEAHRGYNPTGSFLANLFEADPNSVKLALTGTPLLKSERASWKVFGDYIHTYYYDKSIQDGYTLKIIREDIETSYKEKLTQIHDSLEHLVQQKEVQKSDIVEHDNYVKELLRYIISDFNRFRIINGDNSIGAMVICETSEQARKMFAFFDEVQRELNKDTSTPSRFRTGLILFDSEDKDTRKQIVENFKTNFTVDILFVFNMLLTGFDAPRLKRLYLGRRLKDHNLLQAITRVNRPYKEMHYGYIVDFADIKENFEDTNKAYLLELNRFNDPDEIGEETNTTDPLSILVDPEELLYQVKDARQELFSFSLDNVEMFSSEISMITDKSTLLDIRKSLIATREAFNIARTFGDEELKNAMDELDIRMLPALISEIEQAIRIFNQKEAFSSSDETVRIINEAMQDIEFSFRLRSTEELHVATGAQQTFQERWRRTIQGFTSNIDQEDPEYITLREAFMKRFEEKGFSIESLDELNEHSKALDETYEKLMQIKRANDVLLRKYNGDNKFVRVHKRIREENERRKVSKDPVLVAKYDDDIVSFLTNIKLTIDEKVLDRNDILKKDAYFEQTVMQQITTGLSALAFTSNRDDRIFVQERISRQYLDQYRDTYMI